MLTREPAMVVSVVVSLLIAALPHLRTFGVPLTPEQVEALTQFLPSALVIVGGAVIRANVTPGR